MPQAYAYLGSDTRGYVSYADTDTGRMLIAEPGGTYGIRAIEEGIPVPPGDGRWGPAGPPPPVIFSPPPPPAADAESGSETSQDDSDDAESGEK